MALIKTVEPDKAEGDVKEGYSFFLEKGVEVPAPLQLTSASPGLLKVVLQRSHYYMNHPNLSFPLLAHIRYMVADKIGYKACTIFNKKLLVMQGNKEEDLENLGADPARTLLEDNEKQILSFVLDAIDDPESVSQGDIDKLHETGWTDNDIFDAVSQGISMMDHNILMKIFKMDPC